VKNLFVIMLLVFVVSLALVLGSRLPVDALTVVIGVGCGVLASIPTSLLIMAVATHRESHSEQALSQQAYPPVVVVNAPPGQSQVGPGWPTYGPTVLAPAPSASRQFHIIGEDDGGSGDRPYSGF